MLSQRRRMVGQHGTSEVGIEPTWTEQSQYERGHVGTRDHTMTHSSGSLRRVGFGIAGCLLALGALTTRPTAASSGAAAASSRGWVAHSAFGLQLSVPKSWGIAYFQNCPLPRSGTLLIGTPTYEDFCTNIPAGANMISMLPQGSGSTFSGRVRHLVVNGLHVLSYSSEEESSSRTHWVVPSRHTVLMAAGAQSSAVLRTLTVTGSRALPAPGMLRGSVYLIALMRTPVTGPVSVTRLVAHGSGSKTVQAYDGQFWNTYPPGSYRLIGHAGNAPCPPVRVTIRSGETTDAPEINCQGV
jgi:hypothetical protein